MAEDISSSVAWRLRKAIAGTIKGDVPQSGTARVQRRDSDGTVWLRLPGSSVDTPVTGAVVASVSAGDVVSYSISGGKVAISGNATQPSVGEKVVQRIVKPVRKIAQEAKGIAEATGQYFWHDDNGAHVSTEKGNPAGGRNAVWNSLGMLFRAGAMNLLAIVAGEDSGVDVYDGQGNNDENTVASFRGSGVRVGRSSESHLELDYHSMKLVNDSGDTYFNVSDLRNSDGNIVESFVGDGTNRTFKLATTADSVVNVKVDGIDATYSLNNHEYVILPTAPADNASVVIEYVPNTTFTNAYTLGYRGQGFVGMLSVAEGRGAVAAGNYSHAEGYDCETEYGSGSHAEGYKTKAFATTMACHSEGSNTTANGNGAHAEGSYCEATAPNAHAEGRSTKATHDEAHAQNLGTIAAKESQTAIGTFNEEDTSTTTTHPSGNVLHGQYAFIVGNGISTSNRSNAFAVDWSGNVSASGRVIGENQTLLWSGAWHMTDTQTATLSESVSDQPNGIVLVWCAYSSGAAQDWDWHIDYVPKSWVAAHPNRGITCVMAAASFARIGSKYVYVSDTAITGNANNNQSGSNNGITYNNAQWVLKEVWGV